MATVDESTRLGTYAEQLRDTCLAALATIGENPDASLYPGLPAVEVGEPPCDGMLAIYVQPISRVPWSMGRAPGDQYGDQRIVRLPQVTLTVVYAHCADLFGSDDEQGAGPDMDDLNEMGLRHMRAGWALMNGVYHAIMRDQLFSQVETKVREFDITALNPLTPQGQAVGWTFDVMIMVDGYDPFE